jgi:enoyl-CoA hydratase/carnithine racemase
MISGFDVSKAPENIPVGKDWPAFVHQLTHLDVLSIASIRGRVRGQGSEFVLACDIRFASREKQFSDNQKSELAWYQAEEGWNGFQFLLDILGH